jgi:hypothetical protein
MRKLSLFNFFALLLGVFLFASCEYASIQPDIPPPPPPGDSTSFSLEIQPIFTQSCAGCHNGSVAPDLREGKSYQSLIDNNMVVPFQPDQSIIYTCLLPGAVMATYGNTTRNTTIKYWIEEGAKNN